VQGATTKAADLNRLQLLDRNCFHFRTQVYFASGASIFTEPPDSSADTVITTLTVYNENIFS
jgi:hypothetical protein